MDSMDIDIDDIEVLQFQIEDLKQELREEKIKYNNI